MHHTTLLNHTNLYSSHFGALEHKLPAKLEPYPDPIIAKFRATAPIGPIKKFIVQTQRYFTRRRWAKQLETAVADPKQMALLEKRLPAFTLPSHTDEDTKAACFSMGKSPLTKDVTPTEPEANLKAKLLKLSHKLRSHQDTFNKNERSQLYLVQLNSQYLQSWVIITFHCIYCFDILPVSSYNY